MLDAAVAVCALALLGILTDDGRGPIRASRARLARLYRAQERWAEQMDRNADHHQAADHRLVA